jgi:hypothetical protein
LKLNDLFAKQDYWTLNEQYSVLKKQASKQYQLFTEAYLNYFFNKPEQSNDNIRQLFASYSNWISNSSVSLCFMAASNMLTLQEYAKTASIYAQFIEQTETDLDSLSLYIYKNQHKLYKSLENIPPMQVFKSQKQTKIPLRKDIFGLLTLPVYSGKEKKDTLNFTIDFGANFSMIEEKFANIFNIRILSDSILIGTPHGSYDYGKVGVAEEIHLGNISITNVIFLIAPNRIVDYYPENEMNAILGLPVLLALENLQITNSDLLISTSKQKKCVPNMLMSNSSVFVQTKSSNQSLCMHFDSGTINSSLKKNYLSKNKDNIDVSGKDSVSIAAWGEAQKIERLKIPNFSCNIGNKTLQFPLIYLEMGDYLSNNFVSADGVLGLDILSQHKKIVIDFKNMYFQIK